MFSKVRQQQNSKLFHMALTKLLNLFLDNRFQIIIDFQFVHVNYNIRLINIYEIVLDFSSSPIFNYLH